MQFALKNRWNSSKSDPKREHWLDWAEDKYSVSFTLYFFFSKRSFVFAPFDLLIVLLSFGRLCRQKRLIQEIKMVLRVLVLYVPLPMFWALFDQQVQEHKPPLTVPQAQQLVRYFANT